MNTRIHGHQANPSRDENGVAVTKVERWMERRKVDRSGEDEDKVEG